MKNFSKMRQGLSCVVMAFLLMLIPAGVFAQNSISVSGIVMDDTNEPVIGAAVMVKGTTIGVITDIDGRYTISTPADGILSFSYVGLKDKEEKVNGRTTINIIMQTADKFEEVLKEVPRVRADAGFPPLVTPTSQIVGTQAVFNVILGERYKTVTKEFKGLVKGSYGKTPAPIDPEFRKKILGDEQPIDCRPADLIEPELEKLKAECAKWSQQDEDVLSYAMFGQVAEKFFEKRKDKQLGIDAEHADKANKVMPV